MTTFIRDVKDLFRNEDCKYSINKYLSEGYFGTDIDKVNSSFSIEQKDKGILVYFRPTGRAGITINPSLDNSRFTSNLTVDQLKSIWSQVPLNLRELEYRYTTDRENNRKLSRIDGYTLDQAFICTIPTNTDVISYECTCRSSGKYLNT